MHNEDEDEEGGRELAKWEQAYEASWAGLKEDASGRLDMTIEARTRRRLGPAPGAEALRQRRGLHRHLVLIIDGSRSMLLTDLRPNRFRLVLRLVQNFVREFFDQNPLAQLSLVLLHDSIAERLTELSGNGARHLQALTAAEAHVPAGDLSMQNGLELARASLKGIPRYGTREVLLILGALATVDPGDIGVTAAALVKEQARVSVLGMGAELYVASRLASASQGTYRVATNEEHLADLLLAHSPPPPAVHRVEASLVQMGFPQRRTDEAPSLCACHKEYKLGGYFCPRCRSKLCELPSECLVCGLTLVASPHLARSYHHLFPVPAYKELALPTPATCFACQVCVECKSDKPDKSEPRAMMYECPQCTRRVCIECDIYIHDNLHNCPGCLERPS